MYGFKKTVEILTWTKHILARYLQSANHPGELITLPTKMSYSNMENLEPPIVLIQHSLRSVSNNKNKLKCNRHDQMLGHLETRKGNILEN